MAARPKTPLTTALNRVVKNSTAVQILEDAAAVELARKYAKEIDGDGDLAKLGPRLLDVLESLLLTPKSRDAMKIRAPYGGNPEPEPEAKTPEPEPIDQLGAVRAQRQRGAAWAD